MGRRGRRAKEAPTFRGGGELGQLCFLLLFCFDLPFPLALFCRLRASSLGWSGGTPSPFPVANSLLHALPPSLQLFPLIPRPVRVSRSIFPQKPSFGLPESSRDSFRRRARAPTPPWASQLPTYTSFSSPPPLQLPSPPSPLPSYSMSGQLKALILVGGEPLCPSPLGVLFSRLQRAPPFLSCEARHLAQQQTWPCDGRLGKRATALAQELQRDLPSH